jgi:hypothetical protein
MTCTMCLTNVMTNSAYASLRRVYLLLMADHQAHQSSLVSSAAVGEAYEKLPVGFLAQGQVRAQVDLEVVGDVENRG